MAAPNQRRQVLARFLPTKLRQRLAYAISEKTIRTLSYPIKSAPGGKESERSKIELGNLTFEAAAKFEQAGVKFALMTDSPVIPEQFLAVEAALCVRYGLSEEGALKAITINAAEAIGLADRVGSLEPGKDADVCLYDAHPLDARARVTHSIVNGEVAFER